MNVLLFASPQLFFCEIEKFKKNSLNQLQTEHDILASLTAILLPIYQVVLTG